MKIAQGIRPSGRLYSTFWSNLSKIFSFGVLYPYSCTNGGEIWHGGEDLLSPPACEISPHWCKATCRPCGAKYLKIGLWVT